MNKKRFAHEWLIFIGSLVTGFVALIIAKLICDSGSNVIYNDPIEYYWFYYIFGSLIVVQIFRVTKWALKIVKEGEK